MLVSEVFSGSKQKIQERGWYQGAINGPDGEVCLIGAIQLTMREAQLPTEQQSVLLPPIYNTLHTLIANRTGGEERAWAIGEWNDDPARTVDEVLELLDEAANTAKEKHVASV